MIPYGHHAIDDDDIRAVVDVLRSDFLTQGPTVPRFERAVADYCGVPHAVAVNSATSALHIACLALGVEEGDRVWTSPNTFVASANCARYCGATVDFVDIDPLTYNLCPKALAAKLEVAEREGRLPKVVVPVHFSGMPCEMLAVYTLAQRYGFKIIEDAAHAIGARYRDSIVGDCSFSDITVFSFHPVKIITTAEGGLATTRSPELARRMQLLRSHGITREPQELDATDAPPWFYEQQLLGFNYRMTDLQAALGLSQIKHLDDWLTQRHELADCYDAGLAELPVTRPMRASDSRSALHLYCIRTNNRLMVFNALRAAGIGVNVHYFPVHMQPYYRKLGFKTGDFPAAEKYYGEAITLPLYSGLSLEQLDYVINQLRISLQGTQRS